MSSVACRFKLRMNGNETSDSISCDSEMMTNLRCLPSNSAESQADSSCVASGCAQVRTRGGNSRALFLPGPHVTNHEQMVCCLPHSCPPRPPTQLASHQYSHKNNLRYKYRKTVITDQQVPHMLPRTQHTYASYRCAQFSITGPLEAQWKSEK